MYRRGNCLDPLIKKTRRTKITETRTRTTTATTTATTTIKKHQKMKKKQRQFVSLLKTVKN